MTQSAASDFTLRIQRPNHSQVLSLPFNSKTRTIVLAGPNGVGKSTIAEELGTEYQIDPNRALGYIPPGAYLIPAVPDKNDPIPARKIMTVVVSSKILENYIVDINTQRRMRDSKSEGLSYDEFSDALTDVVLFEDQDSKINYIRSIVGGADIKTFTEGDSRSRYEIYQRHYLRFMIPSIGQMTSTFIAYYKRYNELRYFGKSTKEVLNELGQPKWELVQQLFDRLGLPYTIEVSDIEKVLHHAATFYLRDKRDGRHISGDKMSMGERAVLALFDIVIKSHNRQTLFVFDDVDGFLHAPLLKRLLTVLVETLEEQNSFALWITHSPVTVQMISDSTFYFLEAYGSEPTKVTKADLVQKLTSGALIVTDNFRFYFVEGADVNFYNSLFDTLVRRGAISPSLQLKFISPRSNPTGNDASCVAVNDIVKVLSQRGFQDQFRGLIDRDNDRLEAHQHVRKLTRYCKENYYFDPLNVYLWIIDNMPKQFADLPVFEGVVYGDGHAVVDRLSAKQLEQIVSYFADKILSDPAYAAKNKDIKIDETISVLLNNNKTVMYPKFLIEKSGKDFKAPYARIYNQLNETKLMPQFLRGYYFPQDLIDMMQEMST